MNTAEIKLQIFREVDALKPALLEELYGWMLNYINSKKDESEWIGLTPTEIAGISKGLEQLDAGYGIPQTEVLSRIRRKYAQT